MEGLFVYELLSLYIRHKFIILLKIGSIRFLISKNNAFSV